MNVFLLAVLFMRVQVNETAMTCGLRLRY